MEATSFLKIISKEYLNKNKINFEKAKFYNLENELQNLLFFQDLSNLKNKTIIKLQREILNDLFAIIVFIGESFIKYNQHENLFVVNNQKDIFNNKFPNIENQINNWDAKETISLNKQFYINMLDGTGFLSDNSYKIKDFFNLIIFSICSWRNFIKFNKYVTNLKEPFESSFKDDKLAIIKLLIIISFPPDEISGFYNTKIINNLANLYLEIHGSNTENIQDELSNFKNDLLMIFSLVKFYKRKINQKKNELFASGKENYENYSLNLPFYGLKVDPDYIIKGNEIIRKIDESLEITNDSDYYSNLSARERSRYFKIMVKLNYCNANLKNNLLSLKIFKEEIKEEETKKENKNKIEERIRWEINQELLVFDSKLTESIELKLQNITNYFSGMRHNYFYFIDKKLKFNTMSSLYTSFIEELFELWNLLKNIKEDFWFEPKDKKWENYILLGLKHRNLSECERFKILEAFPDVISPKSNHSNIKNKKTSSKKMLYREVTLKLFKQFILNYLEQMKTINFIEINFKVREERPWEFNKKIKENKTNSKSTDIDSLYKTIDNVYQKRKLDFLSSEKGTWETYLKFLDKNKFKQNIRIEDLNKYNFSIFINKTFTFKYKILASKKKLLQITNIYFATSFKNFEIDYLNYQPEFNEFVDNLPSDFLNNFDNKKTEIFTQEVFNSYQNYKKLNGKIIRLKVPLKVKVLIEEKKSSQKNKADQFLYFWNKIAKRFITLHQEFSSNKITMESFYKQFIEKLVSMVDSLNSLKINKTYFLFFILSKITFFETLTLYPNRNFEKNFIENKEFFSKNNLSSEIKDYQEFNNRNNIDYVKTLRNIRDKTILSLNLNEYFQNSADYLKDAVDNKKNKWVSKSTEFTSLENLKSWLTEQVYHLSISDHEKSQLHKKISFARNLYYLQKIFKSKTLILDRNSLFLTVGTHQLKLMPNNQYKINKQSTLFNNINFNLFKIKLKNNVKIKDNYFKFKDPLEKEEFLYKQIFNFLNNSNELRNKSKNKLDPNEQSFETLSSKINHTKNDVIRENLFNLQNNFTILINQNKLINDTLRLHNLKDLSIEIIYVQNYAQKIFEIFNKFK